MYLRKTISREKEYYQICETENGRVKVLLHLGSLQTILKKFQYIEELERTVSMLRGKFQYIEKLERTVSMLKGEISQYASNVNQVYDKVTNELKDNE